jgi:thiamine biosynthesis protein ThiS
LKLHPSFQGAALFIGTAFLKRGRPLRLLINGEEKDVRSSENIEGLLRELDINGRHIAVALNLEVIPRSRYAETRLKEGDKVEIVHAVGGGA